MLTFLLEAGNEEFVVVVVVVFENQPRKGWGGYEANCSCCLSRNNFREGLACFWFCVLVCYRCGMLCVFYQALALENSQLREQLKQLRLQYSTLQDLQQRGLIQHVPPSAEIPPSEPSRDADLQHQQQEGVLTTPSETSKDPILQEQRFTGNAPPIAEITLSEPSQAEQEGEEQIGMQANAEVVRNNLFATLFRQWQQG